MVFEGKSLENAGPLANPEALEEIRRAAAGASKR